jgi:hypothetical protein
MVPSLRQPDSVKLTPLIWGTLDAADAPGDVASATRPPPAVIDNAAITDVRTRR